ncbi:hypothetical protein MMC07_000575 [Pseudocyphellaria aurata]|nr:hypothetical protein [Pseudocyphellaria aurata]
MPQPHCPACAKLTPEQRRRQKAKEWQERKKIKKEEIRIANRRAIMRSHSSGSETVSRPQIKLEPSSPSLGLRNAAIPWHLDVHPQAESSAMGGYNVFPGETQGILQLPPGEVISPTLMWKELGPYLLPPQAIPTTQAESSAMGQHHPLPQAPQAPYSFPPQAPGFQNGTSPELFSQQVVQPVPPRQVSPPHAESSSTVHHHRLPQETQAPLPLPPGAPRIQNRNLPTYPPPASGFLPDDCSRLSAPFPQSQTGTPPRPRQYLPPASQTPASSFLPDDSSRLTAPFPQFPINTSPQAPRDPIMDNMELLHVFGVDPKDRDASELFLRRVGLWS